MWERHRSLKYGRSKNSENCFWVQLMQREIGHIWLCSASWFADGSKLSVHSPVSRASFLLCFKRCSTNAVWMCACVFCIQKQTDSLAETTRFISPNIRKFAPIFRGKKVLNVPACVLQNIIGYNIFQMKSHKVTLNVPLKIFHLHP